MELLDHFIISDKFEYKLFSKGSSFVSEFITNAHTLKSGKEIPAHVDTRRHRNLSAALNSPKRPDKIMVREIIKQTY